MGAVPMLEPLEHRAVRDCMWLPPPLPRTHGQKLAPAHLRFLRLPLRQLRQAFRHMEQRARAVLCALLRGLGSHSASLLPCLDDLPLEPGAMPSSLLHASCYDPGGGSCWRDCTVLLPVAP